MSVVEVILALKNKASPELDKLAQHGKEADAVFKRLTEQAQRNYVETLKGADRIRAELKLEVGQLELLSKTYKDNADVVKAAALAKAQAIAKATSAINDLKDAEARESAKALAAARPDRGAAARRIAGGLGFGGVANDVDDLAAGLKAIGPAAGIAAVAVAAFVAEVVLIYKVSSAIFEAVMAADELAKELEFLADVPGFEPVSPEALKTIEDANLAVESISLATKELTVLIAADAAPAVEYLARIVLKLSLALNDAYRYLSDIGGELITVDTLFGGVDEAVQLLDLTLSRYNDTADQTIDKLRLQKKETEALAEAQRYTDAAIAKAEAFAREEKEKAEARKAKAAREREAAEGRRDSNERRRDADAEREAARLAKLAIAPVEHVIIDFTEEMSEPISELATAAVMLADSAKRQAENEKVIGAILSGDAGGLGKALAPGLGSAIQGLGIKGLGGPIGGAAAAAEFAKMLGDKGAQGMIDEIKQAIRDHANTVTSVLRELPTLMTELIPQIVKMLPQLLSDLIVALVEAIPALLKAQAELLGQYIVLQLYELPRIFAEAFTRALIEFWNNIKAAIKEFFESPFKRDREAGDKGMPKGLEVLLRITAGILTGGLSEVGLGVFRGVRDAFDGQGGGGGGGRKNNSKLRGFATGGYVPSTRAYMLHEGERVVPPTGAGTQTAMRGMGGSGPVINVGPVLGGPAGAHDLIRFLNQHLAPGSQLKVR
jgi:hypothetical protein